MERGLVTDLEEQVAGVWNPDVRPLVAEAFRCYSTGAARACITLTWTAVCSDLIEKVRRLAEDGENHALQLTRKIDSARGKTDPSAILTMQNVERDILGDAEILDLIDSIEHRDLERLREDRNFCAHPSLRPLGEFYEPNIQYARTHLTVALSAILAHPPSQGRKAVDRFREYVRSRSFNPNPDYIVRVYFDNVKASARRQIIDLAIKHSMLELATIPDPQETVVVANRMAACALAFAARDRPQVQAAIKKSADRLRSATDDTQLRAVGRLGDLDIFWSSLDDATRIKLDQMVARIPGLLSTPLLEQIDEDSAAVISLVSVDEVRSRIPAIKVSFAQLAARDRATVIERRPSEYFAPLIPKLLEDAGSFRMAEYMVTAAVIPCARFLTLDQLKDALHSWAENDQCRRASGMIQLAIEFYAATLHLQPDGKSVWRQFISDIQQHEEPGSYYSYAQLEEVINQ